MGVFQLNEDNKSIAEADPTFFNADKLADCNDIKWLHVKWQTECLLLKAS